MTGSSVHQPLASDHPAVPGHRGVVDQPSASGNPGPPCAPARPRQRPLLATTLDAVAPALEPVSSARTGRPGPSGEWLRCADLLTTGELDRRLRLMGDRHGYSGEVAATQFLGAYAGSVVGPAIAVYVVHRRVPDVGVANMSLRDGGDGWFDSTAFHSGRLTGLAGDPELVGARPRRQGRHERDCEQLVDVVADLAALRQGLVDGLVGHLAPVVTALRVRVRLGLPALWGSVAAVCGRAFLLTERITCNPDIGRDEADAFFALACPPMRARPEWFRFIYRGRQQTAIRRRSCCLAHRASGQYCTTCPFTDDSERERRLREWIDAQGDAGLAVG